MQYRYRQILVTDYIKKYMRSNLYACECEQEVAMVAKQASSPYDEAKGKSLKLTA